MRAHLLLDVPLIAAGISLYPAYGLAPIAGLAAFSTLCHTWGVINPRSSFYLPVQWRLPADCQDCALTFDDGPHPETTPRVLDLLAEHQQRATFFCIGRHAEQHPDIVRRIHAEGHSLGLHSYSHSRLFNCWPPGKVRADLEANAKALADATGTAPPRLWRPPVGLKNPIVAWVAGRMQLRAVTWSGRGLDTGTRSPGEIQQRLLRALAPRAILVLHDGHEPGRVRDTSTCVTVLQGLLPELAQAGLRSRALALAGKRIVAASIDSIDETAN